MLKKIKKIHDRYVELEKLLADPEVVSNRQKYQDFARERAGLSQTALKYEEYERLKKEIVEAEHLIKTEKAQDIIELAREEKEKLGEKSSSILEEFKEQLLEEDENLDRDIIIEIRAGTGGDEAAIFAADLYRMYQRYAQNNGWRAEIMEAKPTGTGGMKEIIFSVQGKNVYRKLRFESGTHRVQRVPVTESQGRIHTSAATVAVLPEAEEVEVEIKPQDLKIDTYRASGAGGQHVNVTDSAVRITHISTGLVVSCQDERSQMKNKIKAMRVLRARLLDKLKSDQRKKIDDERRLQVGTGDRSGKIRTYNFPDGRITDHRIGFTTHRLDEVLNGELDPLIEALQSAHREDLLNMGKLIKKP
ncbi:MAG: peptide chain release factor 1 [Candidatus Omnitrophota bacterium]